MRIQTKLTFVLIILCLGVILIAGTFSTITLDTFFRSRLLGELKTQADELEYTARSARDSSAYRLLQGFARAAGLRATLIGSDGAVLFESELPADTVRFIENHRNRPEVRDALALGAGTSTRQSATLNLEMLYYAKRVDLPFPGSARHAAVLRVGIPLSQVSVLMSEIRSKVIIASSVALVIVILVSVLVSRSLALPVKRMAGIAADIRAGNYERRLPVTSRDELGSLGETLNGMIDQLNADIAKLRRLERVRSEFLGNVSHELRTPIFAIQGMLETLLRGAIDDPEVNRGFVERALHNTQRLNALLGDLIEISRIQSGDMKLSFRYFSLQEFLTQIATEMKPVADRQGVALTLDATVEGNAYGDRERLKQVMTNLIENAVKYNTPEGSVHLSAEPVDGGIRVIVKDTGVGIAEEHLGRIFERFYRVDRERSREAGGTGLGLAIVKHIVEAHGSSVEVESRVGVGSTFSFVLRV